MSTVRVYKSTDPGAPAHPSATRGSMAALLRACLVTGYGSGDDYKAPAGWEEPYLESGNYACFRALSGSRHFFQVDDNQADADVTRVLSFESMSDVQNGSGNWLTSGAVYGYLGKRRTASDSYSTEWIVIADEQTVYVFLKSQYGLIPHGFGDCFSLLKNDYLPFFFGHGNSTGLPISTTLPNVSGLSGVSRLATSDSKPNGYIKSFSGPYMRTTNIAAPFGNLNNYPGNYAQTDPSASFPGSQYYIVSAVIKDYDEVSDLPVGLYRGMYFYVGKPQSTHMLVTTINGQDYLPVDWGDAAADATRGQLLFSLGSWD